MRKKTKETEKEVLSPKESAKASSLTLLKKGLDADILFALCDMLGVLGGDLAEEVGVTKAQISHYRQRLTEIPKSRLTSLVSALESAIKGASEQLHVFKGNKSKSNPKLEKLVVENLESRINVAKEILEINRVKLSK